MTKSVAAGHIAPLTGVRGAAALWVLLHHLLGTYPIGILFSDSAIAASGWSSAGLAVRNLASKGWLGVDLFFVLSGFVITYVYRSGFVELRRAQYVRFLKLRIARIYPAHVATTVMMVPMVAVAWLVLEYRSKGSALSGSKLAYSLFLLNGWGFPNSVGWNVPSWSVSSEWLAYLCFPLISAVAVRFRTLRASLVAVAALFIALVLLAAGLYGKQKFMFDANLTALRVLSEFTIGCFAYNIFACFESNRRLNALSTLAVLVTLVAALVAVPARFDWVFILAFAALVLGLSRGDGFVARFFASRLMVYLGEISYSIYLIHALVLAAIQQLARRWLGSPSGMVVVACAVAAVLGSIAGGHVLYATVEWPWRTRLRNAWTERSRRAGARRNN